MGSVGDCFDNAMCESFFATLECELLDRRRFKTQIEARMAVFEFIEGWYNPHRRHSALDYLSPINYERIQQTENLTASPTPSTETGQLQRTALLRKLKDIFRRFVSRPVDRVVELINPILRGWVNYFAIGNASRCFGFVK